MRSKLILMAVTLLATLMGMTRAKLVETRHRLALMSASHFPELTTAEEFQGALPFRTIDQNASPKVAYPCSYPKQESEVWDLKHLLNQASRRLTSVVKQTKFPFEPK